MEQYNTTRRSDAWRVLTQIVWYALDLIVALLALRIVLRLLGANPQAGFTQFVYNLTYPFYAPFSGVIPSTVLPGNNNVMEWSSLLAMLVYWIIAGALVRIIALGRNSTSYRQATAATPDRSRSIADDIDSEVKTDKEVKITRVRTNDKKNR